MLTKLRNRRKNQNVLFQSETKWQKFIFSIIQKDCNLIFLKGLVYFQIHVKLHISEISNFVPC